MRRLAYRPPFSSARVLTSPFPLLALLATLNMQGAAASEDPRTTAAPLLTEPQRAVMLAVGRAGRRLIAVGERGIVLISDDNGAHWRQSKVPVSVTLCVVRFADDRNGWAAGHSGVVLHSTDAGETWTRQLDGDVVVQLMLRDAETRVATAPDDAAAAKALAEAKQLVADGPDKPFLDLFFTDAATGFVTGAYGMILHTGDAGHSWQPWTAYVDNRNGAHLYALKSGAKRLYLAGEQGYFAVSEDGQHFEARKVPYDGTFFGALALGDSGVILFGLRGTIMRSSDAGRSWLKIATGEEGALQGGVRLKDGTIILVSDRGRLLASRDEGEHFVPLKVAALGPLSGIAEAEDGAIVVAGIQGLTRLATGSSGLNASPQRRQD